MDQREQILKLGSEVSLDSSIRVTCIFCEAKDERSFSISRTSTGLLYHCFRASCGKKGIIGDTSRPFDNPEKRRSTYRHFSGDLSQLPELPFGKYFGTHGLERDYVQAQGIRFAPRDQRIYIPIYNSRGFQIGENLKAIHAGQKPRADMYRWGEELLIHFPLGQALEEVLVLTEDQISAIKTALIVPSAALLGTNMNDDCLTLFRKIGIKKIIRIMDGDHAGHKATIRIENKLRPFFETRAVYLPPGMDPKDCTLQQLEELLNG